MIHKIGRGARGFSFLGLGIWSWLGWQALHPPLPPTPAAVRRAVTRSATEPSVAGRLPLLDSFEGTTDQLGVMESGTPWIEHAGLWGRRNGAAVLLTPDPTGPSVATVATDNSDVTVQAALTSLSGASCGSPLLVVHFRNLENYLYVEASGNDTYCFCAREQGQVRPVGRIDAHPRRGDLLRVTAKGECLTLSINRKRVLVVTEPHCADATQHGLGYLYGQGGGTESWDDFAVIAAR